MYVLRTSREVNEAKATSQLQQAVCVRRKKKTKNPPHKIPPHLKHTRNPLQPGDRDHLETRYDETLPTRQPILARFHRSRVGGNRPRTAHAISIKNHECYAYTSRLIKQCNLTHPGIKRLFRLQAKKGLGRSAPSALPYCKLSRHRSYCCEIANFVESRRCKLRLRVILGWRVLRGV